MPISERRYLSRVWPVRLGLSVADEAIEIAANVIYAAGMIFWVYGYFATGHTSWFTGCDR